MRSKYLSKLLAAGVAVVVAMALVVPTAGAVDTPKPGYTQFTGCPSKKENKASETCIRSTIKSGNFKMGNKNVPITSPITLLGGLTATGDIIANSKGGLLPAKQKVPGGVIGLTGLTWLAEFLGSEALTLYAETQAVGVPNLTDVLKLPIRVHLINSALGNNCYVGSPADPIKLNLITGTTSPPPPNKPITGREFDFAFDEKTEIIKLTNGTFVDNSFSAPGANGCVLTLFGFLPISINGIVNLASGLPAAAGTNETVQNSDSELANSETVYAP